MGDKIYLLKLQKRKLQNDKKIHDIRDLNLKQKVVATTGDILLKPLNSEFEKIKCYIHSRLRVHKLKTSELGKYFVQPSKTKLSFIKLSVSWRERGILEELARRHHLVVTCNGGKEMYLISSSPYQEKYRVKEGESEGNESCTTNDKRKFH